MPRPPHRRTRLVLRLAAVLAALLAALGSVAYGTLRASLPSLEGELMLAGLSAPVSVERDARGIPTLSGRTRRDVACATGFVHAQERFFQMDLLRRRAAGELAELFGRPGVALDRAARLHRFRHRAEWVLAEATSEERALVEAYTVGVNAGLARLRARPFEYLILRSTPAPWRAEDCVLVLAAMFLQLQDSSGTRDTLVGLAYDHWPSPVADFLTLPGSDWDTPLLGPALAAPPVPGREVLDLRKDLPLDGPSLSAGLWPAGVSLPDSLGELTTAGLRGSNAWAVAGRHTADGAALLANDMHLGLSVPNIWFYASLTWECGEDGTTGGRVTGVTLPGLPAVVAGSNGRVAWGFSNATIDTTDLVVLEPDPTGPGRYLTPDGPHRLTSTVESIRIRGAAAERLDVVETRWGPVIDTDWRGQQRALAWVAHHSQGLNLRLLSLEAARDVDAALDAGAGAGMPAQNLVVADAGGHVGWSIAGRLPRRIGFDGRVPTSWSDGTRRWEGWLTPAEYPRVVDPDEGFIVTANNRLAGGPHLERLGDGGYDEGARARQIHDALLTARRVRPRDMLAIQLDDRALFLERWRGLALATLDAAALATRPGDESCGI